MIEQKLVQIKEEDDPERCEAPNGQMQCRNRRTPGSPYCLRHGGHHTQKKEEAKNVRNYRLAQYQCRVDELAENPRVKSLREEIGITRMLLEMIIVKCEDPNDLFMFSGKISELVSRIEKLVTSCDRLEKSSNLLLDKSSALQAAMQIVEIISTEINDPIVATRIAERITVMFAELQGAKIS